MTRQDNFELRRILVNMISSLGIVNGDEWMDMRSDIRHKFWGEAFD